MTPDGQGIGPMRAALEHPANEVVVLRCAVCKGWRRRTKWAKRALTWENHLTSLGHYYESRRAARGRKARTRKDPKVLRLLQDTNGRWRL